MRLLHVAARMAALRGWGRGLGLAALLALAGCASGPRSGGHLPPTPQPPAADAIVVYGGFGFLNGDAQPMLAAMVRHLQAGETRGVPAVAREITPLVEGLVLQGVSREPVVTSKQQFEAIAARRLGIPPEQVGGLELKDQVEGTDIILLTLLGGLEADATFPLDPQIGGYRGATLATVTAVLSRPVSGEVLLAADASTLIDQLLDSRGGQAERLAEAYVEAARGARDALLRQTRSSGLGSGPQTMVTEVALAAPGAGPMLGARSGAAIADPCNLPEPCPKGSQNCRAFRAAAAAAASEVLARQGDAVLPPWPWSKWWLLLSRETGQRLGEAEIPTAGGYVELKDKVRLALQPERAERKIVVVIDQLDERTVDAGTLRRREVTARVHLAAYGPGPCASAAPTGTEVLGPGTGTIQVIEHPTIWKASGGSPPDELVLIWAVGATRTALGHGGEQA